MANPVVTFEMENGDIMKAELYPEIAPNTVKNFISLVKGEKKRVSYPEQRMILSSLPKEDIP